MSDVVRMLMRLSQRESRMTQSEIRRMVRAAERGAFPTAAPIRTRDMAPTLPYWNVNVYVPRRLAR